MIQPIIRHGGMTKYDAVGSSRNYESDLDDETTLDRIVRQRVWPKSMDVIADSEQDRKKLRWRAPPSYPCTIPLLKRMGVVERPQAWRQKTGQLEGNRRVLPRSHTEQGWPPQ